MRVRLPHLVVVAILSWFVTATEAKAQPNPPPAGEFIYVSTGFGNQVLKIDANTGAVTVIAISNLPTCGENFVCFDPEGMVVGPDSKVYMADPSDGEVFRMDQSGANLETAFGSPNCTTGPCTPQNPIFSGSAARDLYFSDPGGDSSQSIFRIAGAGFVATGGAFNAPTPKISADCEVTYCALGQGAAFDSADNLVFNDIGAALWSSPPSYTSLSGPPTFDVGSGAVALDKSTGQVFVADNSPGGSIRQVGGDGAYYTFTSPDTPRNMAFDASGHLFVVTVAPVVGSGSFGKVWRIDPPIPPSTTPTATKITDLNALFTAGGSGLNGDNAAGVALPSTSGPTETATLHSTAGSFTLSWDGGRYTFEVDYPAGMFPEGATANVTPTETSEAEWALRTPPTNPYFGTQIAPVAGENGDGIIFSAFCTYNNAPCPVPPNGGSLIYSTITTWKSSQPNYCSSNPLFLKADPIGSDNWMNTLVSCTVISNDPTYGGRGSSNCSSSSCLSDWADVFNANPNYTFIGFASPINNNAVNVAKAGRTIPVAFRVLGGNNNPVTNLATPPVVINSAQVNCGSLNSIPDSPITSTAAGNSGFQNLGGGNYQFNWKTDSSWGGTCRTLQVNVGDGITHMANFQFK